VDLLAEANLIDNQIVPPGTNNMVQSRMRPTPLLLRLMAGTPIVPVRHSEVLMLRDDDHNLIDYAETRQTCALRRQVQEMNEYLGGIRLSHPAARSVDERCIVIPIASDRVCVLALDPYVIRKFCRGCWYKGGRFYGSFGSYQLLPKDVRSEILINGEPVTSLDYTAMHTTIVCNLAGVTLDGDPYDIPGFHREEVKLGLNITFNAVTLNKARGALAGRLTERAGRDRVTDSDYARATQAIDAIREKHSGVASAFGSDNGVEIQFRDSEIIREVISACAKEGGNGGIYSARLPPRTDKQ
jgi:hypothetical protein